MNNSQKVTNTHRNASNGHRNVTNAHRNASNGHQNVTNAHRNSTMLIFYHYFGIFHILITNYLRTYIV